MKGEAGTEGGKALLELLFCWFVAPHVLSGFALPGACTLLKTGLALCIHQRLTFIYLLTPEPKLVGVYKCVDYAAYYKGRLFIHPKGKDYIISGNTTIRLPSSKICYMGVKGGVLLVVGKGWAAAFNATTLDYLWGASKVACPADLSPDGRVVALYDEAINKMVFINITEARVIKMFNGKFRDVSLTKYGYLLTNCNFSIFNGKKLKYGGCEGIAWRFPLFLSCKCKGVLAVIGNKDYCYDMGIQLKHIALVNDTVVGEVGGVFFVISPYYPSSTRGT